ncbi:carbon-nitrogen hydrolase family protein [Nitrincola nitratireducens]|uniref:(R)-stereoselective amidase n=1 Tax=Nitrincola nitratireducens TaxID=1229521 RepID=W9V4P6_9GAMM|nr:carbon-nitrogen hydrolase family protein [Nitrincola nitratireducens]EXJ11901.1 (R)-stereoselective amidase [Nitrincola nitratireducens]
MKIAVAQTSPTALTDTELYGLEALCEEAAQQGADILVTPEMGLTGYEAPLEALSSLALFVDDAILQKARTLAKTYQLAIVLGYAEMDEQGRFYNSAQFISAEGKCLQNYRKTHLYGDLDKSRFCAGSELMAPVTYRDFKISLAICYDVEFPELVRWHRCQGADLLLVPTANMHPFTTVATHMIPSRSMENGMVIAYANYTGLGRSIDYCGRSSICAADGQCVATLEDSTGMLIADIQQKDIETARRQMPYLSDRRLDLY